MPSPRDISPLLQKMRNFLLGRTHITALRFEEGIAARTQPDPDLPDGPSHKLSDNYYYTRDARREVDHPNILADNQVQQIAAGSEAATTDKKHVTPGKVWRWD